MDELVFAGFRAFEPDAAASGLIVARIGGGTDFLVFAHARNPNFDVVGFGHGRADVSGGEQGDAVVQAEALHEFFGFGDEFFERGFGIFGTGELEHFDFVELVAANHAPLLRAVTARFLAIAGRVRKEFFGQVRFQKDLVSVKVDQRGFRGGQEELHFVGVCFEVKHIVGKFGELPGGKPTGFVENVWGQDKFVAVADVAVDKVVEQCPFEARAIADVEPETGTPHFDAALVVDQAEVRDEVDVIFGVEVRCGFFAPSADRTVVFLASARHVVGRDIGKPLEECVDAVLDFRQVGFEGFDAGRDVAHFPLHWGDVFAGFFEGGNLCGDFVAFFAQVPGFCDVGAARCVPGEQVRKVYVVHAFF